MVNVLYLNLKLKIHMDLIHFLNQSQVILLNQSKIKQKQIMNFNFYLFKFYF